MARRLLATLFVAAAAFALTAQADSVKIVPKTPKPASTGDSGDKFDPKRAGAEQEQLKRQYLEFRQSLLRLAQNLELSTRPEDKDKAEMLRKVLEQSQKGGTDTKFAKLIEHLRSPAIKSDLTKLGEAADVNEALRRDLATLLRILESDNRSAQLAAERKRHEKMLEAIKDLIRRQERLRAQTEQNRGNTKDIAQNQGKVADAIKDLIGQGKGAKGAEGKKGEAKGNPGKQPGKEGKDGRGEGKKDTAQDKGGKKGENGKGKEGKEGKPGASKDGKEGKPGEGKKGEGKDGKGGEGKQGQGKEGKAGQGKEGKGKDGEGKDGKGGKAGEAKDGKGKPGKPSDKPGQPKEGKPGDKQGDAKPGQPKDGKPGAGKPGGKPSDAKPGDGKKSQGGESKGKSDGKGAAKGDGKPSKGKPGQGGGKPSQGKPSQGGGKSGSGKSDSKQGGQQQPPPEAVPARKQIEDAASSAEKAKDEVEKPDRVKASEKQDETIDKLEQAKKKLEELLKQIREEEVERLLAALQQRCEDMRRMQIQVYDGTVDVHARIKGKMTREQIQRSNELGRREEDIVKLANIAINLIVEEGSAIAFGEVFKQVQEDMVKVAKRLGKLNDVGMLTQNTEKYIIETLTEMIEALKKARKENKNKKNKPSKPGQSGKPPPQDLIDLLAELKMIRSMQVRVNKQTQDYHKFYPSQEQAPDPATFKDAKAREQYETVQSELKNLAERQQRIEKITKDLADGKNKTRD